MDDNTLGYVGDLIRTAQDNHERAIALLTEALKLVGAPVDD